MIAYGMYYRKFIESFFLNSLLRKFIKTNLKHYLLYLKIHFWFKIVITYGCFSLKFTLVFKKRCRLLVWRSSLSDSHTVCTTLNVVGSNPIWDKLKDVNVIYNSLFRIWVFFVSVSMNVCKVPLDPGWFPNAGIIF